MVARVTKLVLTALLLGACDFDDDFNDGFDDGFAVHSLCSCGPGALVLPFMLVQTRSVGVAFYARANQERYAMQFRLVQARRNCCRLLGSCGQGTLVLPFMLVQTRSLGVAFYAHVDQELWCCLLCSCRPGALCHAV
ncbi:hypothetical protein ACFX1T_009232 [Malus domestica]